MYSHSIATLLKNENPIRIYLFVCMLSAIPAFATSAIIFHLSFIPYLNIGNEFSWSGISITDIGPNRAPFFAIRILFIASFGLSLAAFVFAFKSSNFSGSWPYTLALFPSALLAFWCTGTIGSTMLYDVRSGTGVLRDVLPHWFDQFYTSLKLAEGADAKSLSGLAKIELYNRLHLDRINNIHNLPYYISSVLLVTYYLVKFGFRNTPLAIWLSSVFVISAAVNYSWSWSYLAWLLAAFYPVASTLLLCILIRFFARAYIDNTEVLQHRRATTALRLALVYWVPFVIAFVAIISAGHFINRQIEEWTYNPLSEIVGNAELPIAEFNANNVQILKPIMADQRLIRDDLGIFIVEQMGKLKSEIDKINEQQSPGSLKIAVISTFDRNIHPSLEGYSPSFRIDGHCIRVSLKRFRFNVACLARDLKNSILNSMYQIPKNAIRNFVIRTTDAIIKRIKSAQQTDTVQIAGQVKKEIIESLDGWTVNTRQGLDLGWFVLSLASLAGLVLLLQSICRALIIVFGRLLVSPTSLGVHGEQNYFTMAPVDDVTSAIISPKLAEGGELVIELKDKETFYVKHNLDVSNANRVFCLPLQPLRNPFARIVSRRYFLRRIESNNTLPLKITDIGSSRFVSIRVTEGSRVAFRWANFVGMTDNAQLEYIFGVKMPMVVLGHIRVPTIRGPGLLILKVNGAATIAKRKVNSDTVAPYRLVAWDASAGFRVVSSPKFFSVYMDDCQIDLLQDEKAVIDIARDGQPLPGLIHQLWKTLRP